MGLQKKYTYAEWIAQLTKIEQGLKIDTAAPLRHTVEAGKLTSSRTIVQPWDASGYMKTHIRDVTSSSTQGSSVTSHVAQVIVTDGEIWEIYAIVGSMIADAGVANRNFSLSADVAGFTLATGTFSAANKKIFERSMTVTASQTALNMCIGRAYFQNTNGAEVEFGEDFAERAAGTFAMNTIPLYLPGGSIIQAAITANAEAGDKECCDVLYRRVK